MACPLIVGAGATTIVVGRFGQFSPRPRGEDRKEAREVGDDVCWDGAAPIEQLAKGAVLNLIVPSKRFEDLEAAGINFRTAGLPVELRLTVVEG
jgi:hypothetical protein